jgi:isopentenyl-diphosphate delta-isomerase
MDRSTVILVDEKDKPLGTAEKLEAHRKGQLHRAFSIFIFNSKGDMLLQQRALGKYHSGGLWTNACCSHPVVEMDLVDFARLRLHEEMGFDTALEKIFDFVYHADMENGLIEHEFDHVYVGNYEGDISYDKDEVMDYCYRSLEDISSSLVSHPHKYTAWFRLVFPNVMQWYQEHQNGSV